MKASLIDTIFLSEKRKNLLLLLIERPRDIDEIKEILNVTSSAMLPQIKKLKEMRIVVQENGVYRLSDLGRVVVEKMIPLLDTVNVLEENYDYWSTRDLTALPSHLLSRIGDLGHCQLIIPDLNHLFEPPQQFSESVSKTGSIMTFASYFHPECPKNYSKLADRGIEVTLILMKSVFERLKKDYLRELESIIGTENSSIFVYEGDVAIGSISVTDDIMMASLFTKDGVLDHQKILSYDQGAIEWAKELIIHYKEMSKHIYEI